LGKKKRSFSKEKHVLGERKQIDDAPKEVSRELRGKQKVKLLLKGGDIRITTSN